MLLTDVASFELNTKTKKEGMSTVLKKTCCFFTSYLLSYFLPFVFCSSCNH